MRSLRANRWLRAVVVLACVAIVGSVAGGHAGGTRVVEGVVVARHWDAKDGGHGVRFEVVTPDGAIGVGPGGFASGGAAAPEAGDRVRIEVAGAAVHDLRVLGTSTAPAVPPTTRWLVLLCAVPDVSADWTVADVEEWFGSPAAPGPYTLEKYWNTISYGQLSLGDTQVIDWVEMPHEADYYRDAGAAWPNRVYEDCTAAVDDQVDFNDYFGVQMYAGMTGLDSAWGTSLHVGPARDGRTGTPAVWIPSDWLFDGLKFIAHEMGHAYGWMHSGPSEAQGDSDYGSVYDVMSAGQGVEYPSGLNTFELPVETLAINKLAAGWFTEARVASYTGGKRTITLQATESPPPTGFLLATIPAGNAGEYYALEARRRVGYDGNLPGDGIIVHLAGGPRPLFYDADHDYDTTDTEARIDAGESLVLPNGVRVTVMSFAGTAFTVRLEDVAAPEVAQYSLAALTGVGQVSRSVVVRVTLVATDVTGVQATYLSEEPATPAAAAPGWRVGLPKRFAVSHGYGRKVVYAWVKDRLGNISPRLRAAIFLDEPPTAHIHAQKLARKQTIPVRVGGTDDRAITAWCIGEQPQGGRCTKAKPTMFTFKPGPDGARTIYVRARDARGASKIASVVVTLDLPGR